MDNSTPEPRKILTPTTSRSNSSKYRSRSLQLKLEIANFASDHSIKQASEKFHCDRKSVREYIENKRKYEDLVNEPGKN
jgi:hypothetical protein